jgi:acyl-CoA reductase-like NAD-dependent aldehyde dehydrogenase
MQSGFAHLVNGELLGSNSQFAVINPATGRAFAQCPRATRAQLDAAVAAAQRAQPEWAARGFVARRALIERFCAALRAGQEALAELLTREQGKPLSQAREEIARAAAQAEGMAGIEIVPELLVDNAERRTELHYRPLGVCGIIIPWNAPVNLAAGPLAAALYTGNTAVLKPSPLAPLTVLQLGALARAIFPAGVVNVLAGDDDFGRWLCEHPGIAKLSFTGSVATGKRVMVAAAGTLKRVTLELGGNDPAIVFDDADVAAVAPKLFFAATVNSGQVCMAVKRIYAQQPIYDALVAALIAEAHKARVGDGMDPAVTHGPLQNQRQYERVRELLADTRRRGGTLHAGAAVPPGNGYFVAPTIVTNIGDDARVVQEEQFGPIVPVLSFKDDDEVVHRANGTRFGLAASVWSRDEPRALSLAGRLDVGTTWINHHRATAATVPFGGAKESGMGRQYSILGLRANMEPHVISVLKAP